MHKMEELREMLCEELDKITKKGELSAGSLDVIDKLTHSIKSIDTIIAMDDAGYSNARGRGRNVRRDSMGRYSSRGYAYDDMSDGNSYERMGRYSRDDAKEELLMELKELKKDAKDHETSQMISHWIKELERD